MSGVVHEPHCNTACHPGGHFLTDGAGMPHLHRTDLAECAACCRTNPHAAHLAAQRPTPAPTEES